MCDNERDAGPDLATHTPHEFLIGVRIGLAKHRSMQGQQNAVKRARRPQALKQYAGKLFESLHRYRPGWRCNSVQDGQDRESRFSGSIQESGHFVAIRRPGGERGIAIGTVAESEVWNVR